MNDRLHVFWNEALVGWLTRNEDGIMQFQYSPDWLANDSAPAISCSLPKQEAAFSRRETRPFFAGLLPDEGQRAAAARATGVSESNDYALLDALGGDVAGALTLLPDGVTPSGAAGHEPQHLDDDEFATILADLPRRPFLVGDDGIRMSLAGAQPKLPVVLISERPALPAAGQPSTHIVKPAIERFAGSVDNEAFSMRLATAIGLTAARVWPRQVGGFAYLLVERFDRSEVDGVIIRLHQEDFCQALSFPPEHKYAAERGPSFADCFGLIRDNCTQPARDVIALLDAAIFNCVIGNADAHGKNFGLLYRATEVRFAPLYDLMVTALYPEVAARFAMPIGRANQLENLGKNAWERFAADMGLGAPFVLRRVSALIQRIESACVPVSEALIAEGSNPAILEALVSIVRERGHTILQALNQSPVT